MFLCGHLEVHSGSVQVENILAWISRGENQKELRKFQNEYAKSF